MSRQPHPMLVPLLNKVTPPARVIAHAVPTRIIRIVQMDVDALTFRIEQLVEHGGFGTPEPKGEWMTLSTHIGQAAGESLGVAFNALAKAQTDLVAKLRRRMAQRLPPQVRS